MHLNEIKAVAAKFKQGLEKLELLKMCMASFASAEGLPITAGAVDEGIGELTFYFAGMRFYIRIRVADRDVDDVGTEYRVPIGWIDWGRIGPDGAYHEPDQSNFFDERGILCELEKEEFYCSFQNCEDERAVRGMASRFSQLISRAITINNTMTRS